MNKIVTLSLCLMQPLIAQFDTLPEIVAYAATKAEYPTVHQDKTSFGSMKSRFTRFKDRMKQSMGFNKKSEFSLHALQTLLTEITSERSTHAQGRFVEKMTPPINSTFVIWGQLSGAFHSLARDLQELKRLGYMRDDLQLARQDIYLLFNGDAIGASPYNVEALMVILTLMKKNPQTVFYLRGNIEDKERWLQTLLPSQIEQHASHDAEKSSLLDLIKKFFDTLPLALYLVPADQREKDQKEVVRISYFAPEVIELEETEFSSFFDPYSALVQQLGQKQKIPGNHIAVAAYLHVDSQKDAFGNVTGLTLYKKNKDSIQWTTASSPTAEFRMSYQFFNDAFVLLETKELLADWIITLYHQDVRSLNGFTKDQSFYVTSGTLVSNELQAKITSLSNELQAIEQNTQRVRAACGIGK